jgi:ABC-2 type transport system ATP-binding protein
MQVRLAFSIAIRANTDILILDEVLAVGDAAFQEKCYKYFEELKRNKKTVVLVTHDMDAVRRFCTKALMVKEGSIEVIGSTNEVASRYLLENMNTDTKNPQSDQEDQNLSTSVKLFNLTPRSSAQLTSDDRLEFDITYVLNDDMPIKIGITILYQGIPILEQSTKSLNLDHTKDTKHTLTYSLPLKIFTSGNFKVSMAIFEEETSKLIGFNTDVFDFVVTNRKQARRSILRADGTWTKR